MLIVECCFLKALAYYYIVKFVSNYYQTCVKMYRKQIAGLYKDLWWDSFSDLVVYKNS